MWHFIFTQHLEMKRCLLPCRQQERYGNVCHLEREGGRKIDVMSLAYNRMMNHIKYMVARVSTGETLKLDMNEYIEEKYPESYRIAEDVCESLAKAWVKSWILLKLVILPCILSGQWNNKCKWLIRLRDLHNKFNSFLTAVSWQYCCL